MSLTRTRIYSVLEQGHQLHMKREEVPVVSCKRAVKILRQRQIARIIYPGSNHNEHGFAGMLFGKKDFLTFLQLPSLQSAKIMVKPARANFHTPTKKETRMTVLNKTV